MFQKILPAIFFIGLCAGFAGTDLHIKVINKNNKTAITASIMNVSTGKVQKTDVNGELIVSIETTPSTFEIKAFGYQTERITYNDASGKNGELTVYLRAVPSFTQEIVVLNRVEPIPTESLKKDALKWTLWGDLNDALGESASFQATHKGGNCADPNFRGMSGDQLRVLWNGMVQPEPGCPNRMDPPTSHFQTRTLSKVEIIKGPYSVRYGLAYGGVINLTSHTGDETPAESWKPSGQIGYSFRQNGDSQTPELLAIAGTERLSLRIDASYSDQDDYEDGDGVELPTSFKSKQFGAAIYGTIASSGAKWQLEARNSKTWDVDYAALPMDASYDINRLFNTKYLVPVGSWFLEMKASYSNIDHEMTNHGKPTFAKVDAVTTADTETVVLKTELIGNLGPWNVVFGADHQTNSKSGERVKLMKLGPMAGNTIVEEVFAEGELTDFGIYAEGSRSFASSMISTGIRLHKNKATADRPDPKLVGSPTVEGASDTLVALTFSYSRELNQNMTFGLASAIGHRTPSITERYIYMFPVGIDAYDYVGNPTLNPESMWQNELFLQYRAGKLSFKASAYYSDITDAISAEVVDLAPRTVGVPGVKQFINIPDAYRYGFDISMNYRISDTLHFSSALGETRGVDETHSEDLPQIPPLEFRNSLKYMNNGYTAQWKWRWVDKKDSISERFDEIATPSFNMHTFLAGYERNSLGIFLEVQNVLDETYSEFLYRNVFMTDYRMTAPGRMAVLRVTKRF